MFQNVLRSLLSVLILAIASLALVGMFWWKAPPQALAHYTVGGRVILGVLIVTSLYGLVRLWKDPARVF